MTSSNRPGVETSRVVPGEFGGDQAVQRRIVVGVSGSAAAAAALRWAAAEASRTHGQMTAVLAWKPQQRACYAPPGPADTTAGREQASRTLSAAVRAVLGPLAAASVATKVVEGMTERVLVELSADADLLVLGSSSVPIAGRAPGPVIRTCLSYARCPVVVVNPETSPAPPARTQLACADRSFGVLRTTPARSAGPPAVALAKRGG
jgi:nucleotide-binding universal stress UspA family protein